MSGVQIAVLPTAPGSRSVPRRVSREAGGHPAVRLLAFTGLGLYGALRWGTLLAGGSTGRLLGLVALVSVLAAAGPRVADRSRLMAVLVTILAAAVSLAIAGVPVSWIVNLRVAVTARAIGDGLSTLPSINVPYSGVDVWVPMTILLGAALLLLTGALVFTFVPPGRGLVRLAGAGLPLLTLAVIPATILRPAVPYLEGVLLFALLTLFLWGDQLARNRMAGVLLPCGLAAAAALAVGPSLDRHRPWLDYRSLASALAPTHVDTFDWTQRYGPLHWPRRHHAVLEIQASRPDYWKAQNLDVFDGLAWTAGRPPTGGSWQERVSASALRRWTETLQVTVRSMSTNNVIAAGSAQQPADVPGGAQISQSPGTWVAGRRLQPGSSYRVRVFSPHPSAAQMTAAGAAYPRSLQLGFLSLEVPESRVDQGATCGAVGDQGIVSYTPGSGYLVRCSFPAFGTSTPGTADTVAAAMRASPYAGAFAVAQRLLRGVSTPYAYLQRVLRFLGHGYRYNERPPPGAYPLESFLVTSKQGYCQHFAGAMALLLRMGGVPARVAVGFTSGRYDRALHHWTVIDSDAHAWVEAWFPGYGWVKFDPTPRAAPALGGHGSQQSSPVGVRVPTKQAGVGLGNQGGAVSPVNDNAPAGSGGAGSNTLVEVIAPVGGVVLLVLLALVAFARSAGDPVAELARAFARTGRPLRTEATLAAVEQRLAGTPEAAAYVRSLRLARFASGAEPPSLRRRRALRGALAEGLGVTGRVRALWAVPPRWQPKSAWRGLNWRCGRRLRALSARDGTAGGGAQPPGHDPAEPGA
jgi:protein-glutamine gamma-glutamyltransferase